MRSHLSKSFSILLVCILVLSSCSQKKKAKSSLLFPYHEKNFTILPGQRNKVGYLDVDRYKVIDAKFLSARPFTEGLGCVSIIKDKHVLYGFIDSTGNYVIEPIYVTARPFHNGRALVSTGGGKYGFIDKTGKQVTPMIFSLGTSDYIDGTCIAYTTERMQPASGFERFITAVFTLGLADAPDKPVYNCYQLDLSGNAIPIDSNTMSTHHADYHELRKQNSLVRYYDKTKGGLCGFKKVNLDEYNDNPANDEEVGKIVIEADFTFANDFEYGYSAVWFKNGDRGYIDTTGKVVVRFTDAISKFHKKR